MRAGAARGVGGAREWRAGSCPIVPPDMEFVIFICLVLLFTTKVECLWCVCARRYSNIETIALSFLSKGRH